MKYFKLRPGSPSFYDFEGRISFGKNEVKAFESVPKSRMFKDALRKKRILPATEEDYNRYKGIDLPPPKKDTEADDARFEELSDYTVKGLFDRFDYLLEEDLAEAKKEAKKGKDHLVKFLVQIEKEYKEED